MSEVRAGPGKTWWLGLLVVAAVTLAGGVEGQEPDTARVVDLSPLEVNVLRGPVGERTSPFAVSALGARALRLGKSGASIEEALAGLPGVQVQNRYNFASGERVVVRGFGARSQFGIRGVKVLVDGIPATMPDGQSNLDHLDLSTLGRVEVLRGPGSALYGNAAGGVLTFETQPPDARPGQAVGFVAGSNGLVNVRAATSGTRGGTGWVASLGNLDYAGFREREDEPDETYGRNDRVLFNGRVTHELSGGRLGFTANVLDQTSENPGAIAAASIEDGTREAWRGSVAQRTDESIRQVQAGATWEGRVGTGTGEIALWGLSRTVDAAIPPSIVDLSRRAGGLRALYRSDAGRQLHWGGGLEMEFQNDDRANHENDGGEAGALTLQQDEEVRGVGAFVQASAELGSRAHATAALRYDLFGFQADDRFVTADDPDDSGGRMMEQFSPSLGVVVALDFDAALWANVATSLETPTTSELANRPDGAGGFNPNLEPQSARGVEVGLRGRAADVMLYEVSVFRSDVSDALIPFEVPDFQGRSFFRNAGEVRHVGFEVLLRAVLGAGVSAQATFSRVDATFESFVQDGEDLSGKLVPGVAPNRLEGLLTQERDGWYWAVDAKWVDEVPVTDDNSDFADSYGLVGVRLGMEDVALGSMRVSPFGGLTNLFDASYAASVVVNAFGGRFYEPGPARGFYVGTNVTFGPR